MPLIHSDDLHFPSWCQLQTFEIMTLEADFPVKIQSEGPREKLLLSAGKCQITRSGKRSQLLPGESLDIDLADDSVHIKSLNDLSLLVRMRGTWRDDLGGSGIFNVDNSASPKDLGDPVSYLKRTNFDCHYHDCDEYWIVIQGRAKVVSEQKFFTIGPGDCLATGMGHHHDVCEVYEPINAVYFETTLERLKRRGHLWEHTHGKACPQLDRV